MIKSPTNATTVAMTKDHRIAVSTFSVILFPVLTTTSFALKIISSGEETNHKRNRKNNCDTYFSDPKTNTGDHMSPYFR